MGNVEYVWRVSEEAREITQTRALYADSDWRTIEFVIDKNCTNNTREEERSSEKWHICKLKFASIGQQRWFTIFQIKWIFSKNK